MVREKLNLHDNVSVITQDRISGIDLVQVVAQRMIADTATDVVAEVEWRSPENDVDDGNG